MVYLFSDKFLLTLSLESNFALYGYFSVKLARKFVIEKTKIPNKI